MGGCTAAATNNPKKRIRDIIANVPPREPAAKRPKSLEITINTSDDDLDLLSCGKKSTQNRILDDVDIAYWLEQQSRKSATANVLKAVNELAKGLEATPGSKTTLPMRIEASATTSETLLHTTNLQTTLQQNLVQACDMPYMLRGVGAFADDASIMPTDSTTTGGKKRRPWMRKNRRPIVGWDQLWL